MEAQGGLWETAHDRKPRHSWPLSLPSAAHPPCHCYRGCQKANSKPALGLGSPIQAA